MTVHNDLLILGIETSCDETSAAVVRGGTKVLSNVISSQIDIHERFGGVVPEVSSRRHVERITLIIEKAIKEADITIEDLSAIAVTQGPGLVGALLIGISAAKALSFAREIPLVAVNHLAGHIYANNLVKPLTFPLVALIVSGGHTDLVYMEKHNHFQLLGRTRDDAAGEAFDKVARLMNLPYPGGPHIDRLAQQGEPKYDFPRAWLDKGSYDFSFSGLKTAVLNFTQKNSQIKDEDLAASFQEAIIDVLVEKSMRAVKAMDVNHLVLGGGVSANSSLRQRFQERCKKENVDLTFPPLELCTDNAAMIAASGTYQFLDGKIASYDMNPDPNLPLK